ncbi:Homocysteine S-methyltransferase [Teratosphaeria nubilosa]|uniref:Homocysteine S-methyltransferase n=1 Tax=Teratosphaeria nubilosa TaxID=161662 RepID=A0A6G1LEH0_9PEZI|nr:Homocysteine S-methyltransferase [Teratosphaeria nubilosa]
MLITKSDFAVLLRKRGTLIIDGALATELEARGLNLNHALWSGKVLRDQPEVIQQVHVDYYIAGADIAITASYQTSMIGLREHFGLPEAEAVELIKRSVRLAQRARCEAYQSGRIEKTRRLFVAGSVGPYGAYLADGSEYRGDYQRSKEKFKDFHRPRMQALVDAAVCLLAIETMPNMAEIEAVVEMLAEEKIFRDVVAWISVTIKDAEHLSDGTPLEDVLALVRQAPNVVAIGVNCIPTELVEPCLKHLSSLQVPEHEVPLLCYPNSGEVWDAVTKTWSGKQGEGGGLAEQARRWRDAGAKLVGGCCRTGPGDVEVISGALN